MCGIFGLFELPISQLLVNYSELHRYKKKLLTKYLS